MLGIKSYNADMLLLVIPTTTYSETVLVMVGSKIIDRSLSLMIKGELVKVTTMWRQAHLGAVMSGSLQLTHRSSKQNRTNARSPAEVGHSSPKGNPVEVRKFCLDDVRGPVHMTQKVTIPPFSTVSVHANSSVKGHCMWVHVLTETMPGSPVVCRSGADSNLWRVTSVVLQMTYLSAQLEHPYHDNSHKVCGWTGYPCQPSPTGSPPNQDFQRV